jgi:hypothetical protein
MFDLVHLTETWARAAVDWLSEDVGPADFGPASLARLDQYIADNAPKWGPMWEGDLGRADIPRNLHLHQRVLGLGCYIGEALRRRHGGRWFRPGPDEPGKPLWMRLEFPNGSWVDPVGAVTMRLRHGWSVASFVQAAADFAEGRATGVDGGDAAA